MELNHGENKFVQLNQGTQIFSIVENFKKF